MPVVHPWEHVQVPLALHTPLAQLQFDGALLGTGNERQTPEPVMPSSHSPQPVGQARKVVRTVNKIKLKKRTLTIRTEETSRTGFTAGAGETRRANASSGEGTKCGGRARRCASSRLNGN